jgi:hypothetical protein
MATDEHDLADPSIGGRVDSCMSPSDLTPLPGLGPKQLRFLGRVGQQLSQLLQTMARGNNECIMIVGRKRMPDGRLVEVILHAKALRSSLIAIC